MGNERYSTHVLELVRNNGVQAIEAGPDDTCFLMFDYFDVLIYKELVGETKHYLNYFSIGDTFKDVQKYKVSYKTLSLYCSRDSKTNPFTINGERAGRIPFLGLIQVSLCKENYQRKNVPVDVDKFLSQCEKEIMEIADKAPQQGEASETVKQIYRSSTTGDFCLVVRTGFVENIYNIALALNDTQDQSKESEEMLRLLTYTNVGIACKSPSDNQFKTLDSNFVNSHQNLVFALRFSADSEMMKLLKQYTPQSTQEEKTQAVKGLFGRYDYLLHIGIEEFAKVYPVLCAKKVGSKSEDMAYDPEDISLTNILKYSHIRNINERVLVEMQSLQAVSQCDDDTEKGTYLFQVMEKNKRLYEKINALEPLGSFFSEEARAFKDLYRGMKEIYKAFSSVGAEKEAYINWLGFYEDMSILCECIMRSMEKYKYLCDNSKDNSFDEDEKRRYQIRLLRDWRSSIQAINQYTRLVQNINYQTYQSPIYELQTQIDTAKTMVAYREAMRTYMETVRDGVSRGTDDGAKIVPIIYPDLSKDEVEVTAPFINQVKDGIEHTREIVCTVPSFEYFGRLYDLLPWMLHEASHHIKILDKDERNQFVAQYLFSYLFEIVIEDALLKLSNDSLYVAIGRAEHKLVDSMVKIAVGDVSSDSEFRDFDFQRLVSEIDTYCARLFPYQTEYEGTRHYNEGQKIREVAFQYYLDQCRKEGIFTDDNVQNLLSIKSEMNYEKRDKLTAELLDRYIPKVFGHTGAKGDDIDFIRLSDIYLPRKGFEKRLCEIAKKMGVVGGSESAIREYCYKVMELYRVEEAYNTIYQEKDNSEKCIKDYLGRVYDDYQQSSKKHPWMEEDKFFSDPAVMHIFRNLWLLDDNQESKDKFSSVMLNIFLNVDYSRIQPDRKLREIVYRETFADLLMATSLDLKSFGYCRQVLQTISDARINNKVYHYNEANNQRFQIVTAVLLEEELTKESDENSKAESSEGNRYEYVKLDGSSIIEKGIIYCEYTLKCIFQKLLDMQAIKADISKASLVEPFIKSIQAQLETYLRTSKNDESYNATLLYVLLHGIETADDIIKEEWEQYSDIAAECRPIKYIFWRLEYFCRGIKNIMQDGYIRVPWDIFSYMKKIRKQIKKQNGFGCIWEQDWECLKKTKEDVSKFYNEPKLVFEKSAAEKLENTIDFIQNYYYYNRFEMIKRESEMNEKNGSVGREG
ncbi:MAG: hypothetical protein J1E01_00595 [Acetatifactor sp.]|nr:hypothetical protein [Acetatifactor sp.]